MAYRTTEIKDGDVAAMVPLEFFMHCIYHNTVQTILLVVILWMYIFIHVTTFITVCIFRLYIPSLTNLGNFRQYASERKRKNAVKVKDKVVPVHVVRYLRLEVQFHSF
jgi:hypothetical protein